MLTLLIRTMPRPVKSNGRYRLSVALLIALLASPLQSVRGDVDMRFVDVTELAGITHVHRLASDPLWTPIERVSGGAAVADFDRDGDLDLYVVTGNLEQNRLYKNAGDGSFVEWQVEAGVGLPGLLHSGPLFFDYDGDGWEDLFVGGIGTSPSALFRNARDGTFVDVSASSGVFAIHGAISASAGDHDGDGDLDLFVGRWQTEGSRCHLWENHDAGRFACADTTAGLAGLSLREIDVTFSGNFVDIDGDGDSDLLVTGDFGGSSVWRNDGHGHFEWTSQPALTDENGMGSAIADPDADGDFDWFVSSIWDGDGVAEGKWGMTGNRMYQNDGHGQFADVTDRTGLRIGDWGWGASFCDFDNDGWLDLIHVNGWPRGSPQFRDTPARLFMASSFGVFDERAEELGLVDRNDGRGVICFDYDRDGDLDVYTANFSGPGRLWRNDGGNVAGHWLQVIPEPPVTGIEVSLRSGGRVQTALVRAGTNYVSQDPAELHFGLGSAEVVERVTVRGPRGTRVYENVTADQRLSVRIGEPEAVITGCSMLPSGHSIRASARPSTSSPAMFLRRRAIDSDRVPVAHWVIDVGSPTQG